MTDLASTIAPKSDQLNADDLVAGPITIAITKVSKVSGEQPISIHFEGDDGKPYKPCLSMRRLLVMMWGRNGEAYRGRRLTLFRDPEITFGPDKVGGIRISHMSDIGAAKTVPLTVTRGRRRPYTVKPINETRAVDRPPAAARSEGAGDVPASAPAPSPFPGDFVAFREWRFDPNEPETIPDWGDDLQGLAGTLAACIKGARTQDARTRWLTYNSDALAALTQANPKYTARLRELANATDSAAHVPSAADEGAPEADGMGLSGAPSTYGATG